MNNKGNFNIGLLVALGLAVLLAWGGAALIADRAADKQARDIGEALDFSTAQSQANLFNFLDGVVNDLQDIEESAGLENRYTAAWDPGAVSSSTNVSLDVATAGAELGDYAFVALDSATSTDEWEAHAKVTGSGTTTIFLEGANDGASLNLSSLNYYLRVSPQDAFSLESSTSTSL